MLTDSDKRALEHLDFERIDHAERVFGDVAEVDYIDSLDDSVDDDWTGWEDDEVAQ